MTIHDTQAVSNDKAKVRWEEPYVSEALNRVQAGGATPGIVHGFHLSPNTGVANAVVEVEHDTLFGNSLATVIDKANNRALTIQETANPSWDFDSIGSTGQRLWLFLYVDYQTGQDTEIEYRLADAAEFGNAWVDKAVQLGSVRVPAGGGTLALGDVEQGSAEFAGLGVHGPSRWWIASENPDFRYGMSGFETSGDWPAKTSTGNVDVGTGSMKIGRANTGSAGGEVGQFFQPLHHLAQDEVLLVRWRMKSANVSGDTEFKLLLQDANNATDEVTYDVQSLSIGSFEWFGAYIKVPNDIAYALANLKVVFPNTSDSGEFFIDRFSVFRRTQQDHIGIESPTWRASEKVYVGDLNNFTASEGEPVWGSMGLHFATGGAQGWFPEFDSVGLDASVPLGDGFNTGLPGSVRSLLNTSWHEYRTRHALDTVVSKRVISGGNVTKANTNEVTVDPFKVRSSIGDPGGSDTDTRFYEEVSSTTVDISSVAAHSWVYWNPNNRNVEAAEDGNVDFSSNPEYVLLAWVEWDTSTPEVGVIYDVRDSADQFEEQAPLTVGSGDEARFSSLRGALKVAQEYYAAEPEIVIKGSVTINDLPTNGPIHLPEGVMIRGSNHGSGQSTIYVANDSNASKAVDDAVFTMDGHVTLKGLTIRPGFDATIDAGTSVFKCEETVVETTFEDVWVLPESTFLGSAAYFVQAIDTTTYSWSRSEFRNCYLSTSGAPVFMGDQSNSTVDQEWVRFSNCVFVQTTADQLGSFEYASLSGCHFYNGDAFNTSISGNTHTEFVNCQISDCSFLDAVLSFQGTTISASRIEMDSGHNYPVVRTNGDVQMSGCTILSSEQADTETDPLVECQSGPATINGCQIETGVSTGIRLNTDKCVVSGCEVTLNDTGSITGDPRGIVIAQTDDNVISGCRIEGFQGQDAIDIENNSKYNSISGITIFSSTALNPSGAAVVSGVVVGEADNSFNGQSGRIPGTALERGNVTIKYTDGGGAEQTISDDGAGTLEAASITEGYINYQSGQFFFSVQDDGGGSPDIQDGSNITSDYFILDVSISRSGQDENQIGEIVARDSSGNVQVW